MRCMERVTGNLTLPHGKWGAKGICCVAQETQTGALYQLEGWEGEGDGREAQKGEDICISMADSAMKLKDAYSLEEKL